MDTRWEGRLALLHSFSHWPSVSAGDFLLFRIEGELHRKPFTAGGVLVNGCCVASAPILYKLCIGRLWCMIEDACADRGWKFEMLRERMKKGPNPPRPEAIEPVSQRNVGFTGTRHGMSRKQKATVRELLSRLCRDQKVIWFRHGDCIGADAQAHEIARMLGYQVLIHPPDNDALRAFCDDAFSVLPARPYLDRNLRIVQHSHILLAAPSGEEVQRSGTWETIRIARKIKVPIRIIMPDGSFSKGER